MSSYEAIYGLGVPACASLQTGS